MDTKLAEITIRELLPKLIQARENIDIAIAMSGRSEISTREFIHIYKQVHEALNKAHQFLIVLSKTME